MSCGKSSIEPSFSDLHFVKDSLLKYEPPRLILHDQTTEKDHQQRCRATIAPCVQTVSLYDQQLQLLDPYSDLCRPADILDFLFPPVESTDRHHHRYIQCVSRHPATKTDVFYLEQQLDRRLKQSQALEVGLCPQRRQLYDECFDELVRHVTIECGERGILLSRIRQTYRQLMKDYMSIYLSTNGYAMRTLLLNEQTKVKLQNQIDHLQFDIEQRRQQLVNAEDHLENVLKLYSRLKLSIEHRYQSVQPVVPLELQQLRTTNKLLKQDLEEILLKKLDARIFESLRKKTDVQIIQKNKSH